MKNNFLIKACVKVKREIFEDRINRIICKKCRIRKDDLIMASFPKSGRTWVRFFMAEYINQIYNLDYKLNWDNFVYLSPSPLCNKRDGLRNLPNIDKRFILSHDKRIGRFFKNRKVIFITRNFFDIIISYYFFHKNRDKKDFEKLEINDFAKNIFNMKEAVNRINYFSKQLPKSNSYFIIPYENLKVEYEKIFPEIINFSFFPYDQKKIKTAINFSSFNNMRKLEKEKLKEEKQENFHTREGKSFKYKNYLTEETISYIKNYLEKNLKGILRKYYLIDHNDKICGKYEIKKYNLTLRYHLLIQCELIYPL